MNKWVLNTECSVWVRVGYRWPSVGEPRGRSRATPTSAPISIPIEDVDNDGLESRAGEGHLLPELGARAAPRGRVGCVHEYRFRSAPPLLRFLVVVWIGARIRAWIRVGVWVGSPGVDLAPVPLVDVSKDVQPRLDRLLDALEQGVAP